MKKAIIGYCTTEGMQMLTKEDAHILTHINLAFGVIENGLLDISRLGALREIERVRSYNPDIKIVLSVGGWTAGGFSLMARTQAGIDAFAESVKTVMDKYALDGIDIDWEYPCSDAAGIDCDPSDKENFTALMRTLRKMAGDKIVSIAAGCGHYFVRDTEMDKVSKYLDYVQLMTYDLRSGFCRQAGHHSGLYHSKGDAEYMTVARSVNLFHEAGVPKEKIVIGAAFYSRHWTGVPKENNGLLQTAASIANYGPGFSDIVERYIGKNGFVEYWDDDAKAPYIFNGSELLSYDNERSIALKCEYVKAENLYGIMYWDHGSDKTHRLLNAMRVLQ